MFFGPGTRITEAITPSLAKQPKAVEQAQAAGRLLAERLSGGHDRGKVALGVMARLGARFADAT
jgi:hypothetical protein